MESNTPTASNATISEYNNIVEKLSIPHVSQIKVGQRLCIRKYINSNSNIRFGKTWLIFSTCLTSKHFVCPAKQSTI